MQVANDVGSDSDGEEHFVDEHDPDSDVENNEKSDKLPIIVFTLFFGFLYSKYSFEFVFTVKEETFFKKTSF